MNVYICMSAIRNVDSQSSRSDLAGRHLVRSVQSDRTF